MEKISNLAKRRGFVYPSAEIYGGVGAIYDFGPLGATLKKNIRDLWWKRFVESRDDIVGIESSIITKREILKASGHEGNFTDSMLECKLCHARFRADRFPLDPPKGVGEEDRLWYEKWVDSYRSAHGGHEEDDLKKAINAQKDSFDEQRVVCPNCLKTSDYTEAKPFNLMFKTYVGPTANEEDLAYLRPETAQGMFTNFKSILDTNRLKIPFGIAQVGKSFRNEITTGEWLFRLREFEIAEIEYFVKPGTDEKWFSAWVSEWQKFFLDLGIKKENLKLYEHPKASLAHYSKGTTDIIYNFPIGWKELAGIANRTDFDLKAHIEGSGRDLSFFDEESKEKFVPYVIEPTLGIERAFFALLADSYDEEKDGEEIRSVLRFSPAVAPVKVAIFPLQKDEGIVKIAKEIYENLRGRYSVQYDQSGSIGRRYRRQDEIGTPYCLTVDFDSLTDKKVTVRDRDSMKQERVLISKLEDLLSKKLA